MLEAIDNTNLFEGLTALGSVDNSNKSALSLKNRTGKEENAVNGHSLHKFSDAECAIFQYNPSGRGGFLPQQGKNLPTSPVYLNYQQALIAFSYKIEEFNIF